MKVKVNGEIVDLERSGADIRQAGDHLVVTTSKGKFTALAVKHGDQTLISYQGRTFKVEPAQSFGQAASASGSGDITAPMPGQIVEISVKEGQVVEAADTILVLEAMKMQQPIKAGVDGKVSQIKVSIGDQVTDGQLLAKVEPHD